MNGSINYNLLLQRKVEDRKRDGGGEEEWV